MAGAEKKGGRQKQREQKGGGVGSVVSNQDRTEEEEKGKREEQWATGKIPFRPRSPSHGGEGVPRGPKQKEGRVRGGRGGCAGVRREVAVQFLTLGFDVVIIGAGIIGLTIARQLLIGSELSVAVVEKAVPCSGATGAETRRELVKLGERGQPHKAWREVIKLGEREQPHKIIEIVGRPETIEQAWIGPD
uniref:FAD dependent oxidoreductase domain-containing protein n=1 Tax=Fagus sylvatica TaxID=28930 RepID=A0A2N9HYB3_FAGSY